MKKQELYKKAKSVFEVLKDEDMLIVTADGQCFTQKNKSAAVDYAHKENGARREKPLDLFEITRKEVFSKEPEKEVKTKNNK